MSSSGGEGTPLSFGPAVGVLEGSGFLSVRQTSSTVEFSDLSLSTANNDDGDAYDEDQDDDGSDDGGYGDDLVISELLNDACDTCYVDLAGDALADGVIDVTVIGSSGFRRGGEAQEGREALGRHVVCQGLVQ